MLGGAPPDLIVAVLQYLMYYEEDGKRVYTLKVRSCLHLCSPSSSVCMSPPQLVNRALHTSAHASRRAGNNGSACPVATASNEWRAPPQKVAPDGSPTQSAHPARFSPDDKFSRERVECKRRFNLLPTQGPPLEL